MIGVPDININPVVWYGLGAVGVGVLVLVLILAQLSKVRVWRCPDGEPVPDFWNNIRNASITKLVGRGTLFVVFLGTGVLLGGCATVLVGVLR